jgi:SAM-dependent methyltransferase/uncharacterized protein YbaR (Trm112 family)
MLESHLQFIKCPSCKNDLFLNLFANFDDGRIKDGLLLCKCGLWYPIIKGVPRLLTGKLRSAIKSYHSEFFKLYSDKLPQFKNADIDKIQSRTAKTHDSYMKIPPPEFKNWANGQLPWISPLTPEFYHDKIILDAGCRIGTRTYYSAKWGAKMVIGIDIGETVEIAYEINRENDNVLILQADIYNMPLLRIFDFAYCMGVLHHLPRQQEGFNKILEKVKPCGTILIWVYQFESYKDRRFIVSLRKITTHLDMRTTRIISILYTMLYCIRLDFFRKTVKKEGNLFFSYLAQFKFNDVLQYLYNQLSPPIANYYKKEELAKWFEDDKIKDYQILNTWDMGWKAIVNLK